MSSLSQYHQYQQEEELQANKNNKPFWYWSNNTLSTTTHKIAAVVIVVTFFIKQIDNYLVIWVYILHKIICKHVLLSRHRHRSSSGNHNSDNKNNNKMIHERQKKIFYCFKGLCLSYLVDIPTTVKTHENRK